MSPPVTVTPHYRRAAVICTIPQHDLRRKATTQTPAGSHWSHYVYVLPMVAISSTHLMNWPIGATICRVLITASASRALLSRPELTVRVQQTEPNQDAQLPLNEPG